MTELLTVGPSLEEESSVPSQLTPADIRELDRRFGQMTTKEILNWAWDRFGQRAAIGTSFQPGGLLLIDLAREHGFDFPVFTLDTGLLFPETIELKKRLEDFFGFEIESLKPELTVKEQSDTLGPELWARDPDFCCTIRKVLPLRDKLAELDCWITGLRRHQTPARASIGLIELYHFNEASGKDLVKLNPVANWSSDAVWTYIRDNKIPYNPLQDRGYRSIGCSPCTHRTAANENERTGRWTDFKKVECGIHTFLAPRTSLALEPATTSN